METERDRAYAWVVMSAAMVNHMLWAGIYSSSSVYILDWIDVFPGGTMALGMVGGTLNGLNFFSGLFVGPLVDRFDSRVVSFAGTFLAVFGLLASSQTTSTVCLYIFYGIIAGFGCGWTSVPPILMVQYYFDKHRPFAAGFALMGQGLGTFILMPVLQLLIQYYGWRGAMIVHAGIVLQGLVVSSLYRQFDLSQLDHNNASSKTEKISPKTMEVNSSNNSSYSINTKGKADNIKSQNTKENPSKETESKCKQDKIYQTSKDTTDIISHISVTKDHPDRNFHEAGDTFQQQQQQTNCGRCINFCSTTWDLSLFRIPVYIQYMIGCVLIQYPAVLFYRFISLKAHEDHISKMEASLLPSIAGLLSTLSRAFFSCVANFKCSNRLFLCAMGALGQGIVVIMTCIAWDFYSYAAFAAMFGFFTGLHATLVSTVLADLIGIVRLAHANSFLSMFSGFAVLSCLPIAGAIIDSTGNFNTPFIMYGVIGCISGTLIFLVPVTRKYTEGHQSHPVPQDDKQTQKQTRTDALKMFLSTESIHSIA